MPVTPENGPVVDYLLKEVSFSTCDNRFFGELEKEMLVPNNVNIHGRVTGAKDLEDHILRLEFPSETVVAYVKQPVSNTLEGSKRVLSYKLGELINFEDYWWLPLDGETEFSLSLNLLPPFPRLNPVDLQITCRPDIAVGLEAYVTTTVRLQAEERIDSLYIKHTVPRIANPGMTTEITKYSGDNQVGPRQSVTTPKEKFPFESLRLDTGQVLEHKIETRITANPRNMVFLKCQQDLLTTKLVALRHSTPQDLPCNVKIIGPEYKEMPVQRTVRSTILQINAQIMYSPFSVQREPTPSRRETVLQTAA